MAQVIRAFEGDDMEETTTDKAMPSVKAEKKLDSVSQLWTPMFKRSVIAFAVMGVLAGAVFAYSKMSTGSTGSAVTPVEQAQANARDTSKVLIATVNGQPIYEMEIMPMMNQVPKAVAVDGYINKVLTAQEVASNSKWSDEAAKRKEAAIREVLSAMYFEKVAQELQASITDEQIKDYYDKNISDAMFAQYAASYALYADPESASEASKALAEGDKEALKTFKRFQDNQGKDAKFTSAQFPYDLGRVIEGLKVGQFSQPLPTRNGYFIIQLNEKVDGKKPEVKDVKNQITQVLVQQKLSENIASLRGNAKIELK